MLREHLAVLLPGGSRARPIKVGSAAVVEVRVNAMACPLCGGSYRIAEHVAPASGVRRLGGRDLRPAGSAAEGRRGSIDVTCRHCSTPRSLWFKLVSFEPN